MNDCNLGKFFYSFSHAQSHQLGVWCGGANLGDPIMNLEWVGLVFENVNFKFVRV